MSKVKVAVIGVGYLGEFHAQKYKVIKSVDLVGIVDTDKKRCQEISKKYGVKPYNNYEDIINEVDAVSIVVPTNLHYKVAKYFLEFGKHILVEKPFVTNITEGIKLEKLAQKRKKIIQVGHIERFNKAFSKLQDTINKPVFIECNRISPFKIRGTEVDVVMDLMIHDIDIIMSLNNSKIKNIQANGASVLTEKTDIANARITFENGCVCNLSASRISGKVERKMRLFQKNSYFSLDYQTSQLDSYMTVKSGPNVKIKRSNKDFSKYDSLDEEIRSFIKSIKNKRKPIVSANDGINVLKCATKISNLIKKQ